MVVKITKDERCSESTLDLLEVQHLSGPISFLLQTSGIIAFSKFSFDLKTRQVYRADIASDHVGFID